MLSYFGLIHGLNSWGVLQYIVILHLKLLDFKSVVIFLQNMLCQTCQCLTLIVSLIFSISYLGPIWYRYARCYNTICHQDQALIYWTFVTFHQNLCKSSLQLEQVDILMLSWLSHPIYLSDIRYRNIYIYNSFLVIMSFYNMKKSRKNGLFIQINQFSIPNFYKQKRKHLLNSDCYFLIIT